MEGDLPEDVDYAVETIDSGDITPSATNNNGIMMVSRHTVGSYLFVF